MPQKTKYDRNALYFEYLTAEEESVYEFFKRKGVISKSARGVTGASAKQSR